MIQMILRQIIRQITNFKAAALIILFKKTREGPEPNSDSGAQSSSPSLCLLLC